MLGRSYGTLTEAVRKYPVYVVCVWRNWSLHPERISTAVSSNCEFHDVNKEIKSAIIQNCQSKRLRRYALREEALSLDNLLAKARSLEVSETQATCCKLFNGLTWSLCCLTELIVHVLLRWKILIQFCSVCRIYPGLRDQLDTTALLVAVCHQWCWRPQGMPGSVLSRFSIADSTIADRVKWW